MIENAGMSSRTIKLTPCFWKEFSYGGCLEFGEECTTVNTSEVTDVALPVELLSNNSETRGLLEIKTSR